MEEITYNLIYLLYLKLNKSKTGKKLKYNFRLYIENIFYVLKYGIPWRAIKCNKLHYTTYHKFFQKLVSLNIFEIANKIICEYYYSKNTSKNYFIDSTMIKNINGKDKTGCNHYDRNRKGNKISVLVDNLGIPVSIHITEANIHDAKLIEPILDNSIIKIAKSRIIADKGYINKKLKGKLRRTNNISLIYPYRNNQLLTNTTFEKNLLKKRHIVENFFCWLKKYRRIQQRYDSKFINYTNFVYFSTINIIAKKIF